ncbi:MAG: adenylate/guanylate cyclase [Cereibacter sp.]|jgi:adenylate cyclase|nr:adenylate/guanylate cyclase [Cereibacter sp.]
MRGPLVQRALGLWAIAGLVLVVCLGILALRPPLYLQLRDLVFDSYQRLSPRTFDPEAPVHIIDIDEASLSAFGQWPWPRPIIAAMTERLQAHGAAAIGFDIVFAEPDRTSPEEVAATWRRFGGPELAGADLPSHDSRLGQTLAQGPSVLAIAGVGTQAGTTRGLSERPELRGGVAVTGKWPASLPRYPAALVNLPVLDAGASGIGAISLGAGTDGIVRTVPVVMGVGEVLVPALSVELLRVAQGAGGHLLRTSEASGETGVGPVTALALRTGAFELPLEADGRFRVHFAGQHPERISSVLDVLGPSGAASGIDPALAARVGGKIVLIGTSAQGLLDIRATPLDPTVPGVTIHAELLEQVIAGQFLSRPDWMAGLEAIALVMAVVIVTAILRQDRPLLALLATFGLSGAAVVAGPAAFIHGKVLVDPVMMALAPLAIFLPGAALGLLAKERARRAIRARFSHFVPADLLPEIEADPDRVLTPRGAERELTVLFVDMQGFSGASEHLSPPQVLALVNTFLSEVSATLVTHRATIDKFMGDAVMAFWNAPIAAADHAEAALGALGPIRAAAARASADAEALGLPPISVRIGVNTGKAAIGLVGSEARLSYTCLGESVNLAARLEGLTRLYGVWNCVGPATAAACPDDLAPVALDLISVKGFRRAVEVSTVLPADLDGLPQFRTRLAKARSLYAARDWDAATAAFLALSRLELPGCAPDVIAGLYLDRIAQFRVSPPAATWDGGHSATSK